MSPFSSSPIWCHLGGRVWRDETLNAAIDRHLTETLGGVRRLSTSADPQPDYVMQWFPRVTAERVGEGEVEFGLDPRKHAVSMCYRVELSGAPEVQPDGEAIDFRWFALEDALRLKPLLWPGTDWMIHKLFPGDSNCSQLNT